MVSSGDAQHSSWGVLADSAGPGAAGAPVSPDALQGKAVVDVFCLVVTDAAFRLCDPAISSATENIFHCFSLFFTISHEQHGWLPAPGAGKAPLLQVNRIPPSW